jgi:hypothetical protein
MKTPKRKTIQTSEESFAQKAVRKYKEAEEELTEYMRDPDVLDILRQFHKLVEVRNERLLSAVQSVKADLTRSEQNKLYVDGIGAQKRTKGAYNIDHLRAYLPRKQQELVITERTVYDLNTEDLNRLVRQGEIDRDIVEQAYHEESAGVASMPGTPKAWELPPLPPEEDIE